MNKVNVGDIYVCNWGYDANFSDFYKVTKVTPKTATLTAIGAKRVKAGNNCLEHGSFVADENGKPHLRGNKTARIKEGYDGKVYFKINNYSIAYRWDGDAIANYNYH